MGKEEFRLSWGQALMGYHSVGLVKLYGVLMRDAGYGIRDAGWIVGVGGDMGIGGDMGNRGYYYTTD